LPEIPYNGGIKVIRSPALRTGRL